MFMMLKHTAEICMWKQNFLIICSLRVFKVVLDQYISQWCFEGLVKSCLL